MSLFGSPKSWPLPEPDPDSRQTLALRVALFSLTNLQHMGQHGDTEFRSCVRWVPMPALSVEGGLRII
jgi:hypothetical protein